MMNSSTGQLAAASPAWDARTLPSPQGIGSTDLQKSMSEEVANKQAEITVLRNRLKEFERDNMKMKSEVAMAKDRGAQNDRVKQMSGEVERLQTELRYAKHDLISSEDERKRLKTSYEDAHTELKTIKSSRPQGQVASAPAAVRPQPQVIASAPSPPPGATLLRPTDVTQLSNPQIANLGSVGTFSQALPSPSRAQSKQWRHDVLLRELSCWEAASKAVSSNHVHHEPTERSASWFVMRETVDRLMHDRLASDLSKSKAAAASCDLAEVMTGLLRAACQTKHWVVVQAGARFVQVLIGLFPDTISMLRSKTSAGTSHEDSDSSAALPGAALFEELTSALHAAVLGPIEVTMPVAGETDVSDAGGSRACAEQLLKTLLEIVGKLRSHRHELDALTSAFERPSLCALLVESPSPGSLHLICLQLVQALLASTELFAHAHRARGQENLLLAIANLLVIPTVEPSPGASSKAGNDSAELQECRVAALQVLCRCLASAPSLDMVLRLRGDPTVDGETFETVLQRVVFLCHHELLCLGIHGVDGDSWHDASLEDCAKRRQRAIELSLMILSSFIWHSTPDMTSANHSTACSEACEALGRMRPLVASIVDMVARRAARSPYYTGLLGSASALRVLLAPADGQDGCAARGDGGAGSGKVSGAVTPMMVVD